MQQADFIALGFLRNMHEITWTACSLRLGRGESNDQVISCTFLIRICVWLNCQP